MANPAHVEIVKSSLEAIREFHARGFKTMNYDPNDFLDLTGADFTGASLANADLSGADLDGANLSGSDLFEADLGLTGLSGANLTKANLARADLINADLTGALLTRANLRGTRLNAAILKDANLTGADLTVAKFSEAEVDGADFSRSIFDATILSDMDISKAKGLDAAIHHGPSTVGVDTLYRSNGNIPDVFLRGWGSSDPEARSRTDSTSAHRFCHSWRSASGSLASSSLPRTPARSVSCRQCCMVFASTGLTLLGSFSRSWPHATRSAWSQSRAKQTDPLGHSGTFAYDAASRRTSMTDRLGTVTNDSFDALNRRTGETWVGGGSTLNTLTYTYDADNNLLTAADKNGTLTMTYDVLNRLSTQKDVFGQLLTNSYDAADNRTLVKDSQGGVATSTYDVLNRLTSRQLGGSTPLRLDLTYTARDQIASETRYTDLAGTQMAGTSSFTYDAQGRLAYEQHKDSTGANIANYTYAYDLADRITAQTLNGTTTSYQYDTTNQLTQGGTNNYGYDANGNRNTTGYQTGANNQMTNDGTWTYTYDVDGPVAGQR